ncbi:hypothetical protein ACFJYU_12275 [Enterococcus faecalis]
MLFKKYFFVVLLIVGVCLNSSVVALAEEKTTQTNSQVGIYIKKNESGNTFSDTVPPNLLLSKEKLSKYSYLPSTGTVTITKYINVLGWIAVLISIIFYILIYFKNSSEGEKIR